MLFLHRYHTAVSHFADRMFKLNSRMVDMKFIVQALFHVAQNALAG